MEALDRLTHRLAAVPGVQAIYLFGSRADGTATDQSDVDLAVLIGRRIALAEELRMRAIAVEELRCDDVDFVILDHAPPLLRYEIIARGRRLFARDDAAADAFELNAIGQYLDTAYLRRIEREYLSEAVR